MDIKQKYKVALAAFLVAAAVAAGAVIKIFAGTGGAGLPWWPTNSFYSHGDGLQHTAANDYSPYHWLPSSQPPAKGGTFKSASPKIEIDILDCHQDPYYSGANVCNVTTNDAAMCNNHPAASVFAVAVLPGVWIPGSGYAASTTEVTLACRHHDPTNDAAISKCIDILGYCPGGDNKLFTACVRAVTGDYCGDGIPHTTEGIALDVYDHLITAPPQPGQTAQGHLCADCALTDFCLEAEWTESGATCISELRLGTADRPGGDSCGGSTFAATFHYPRNGMRCRTPDPVTPLLYTRSQHEQRCAKGSPDPACPAQPLTCLPGPSSCQ